MKNISPIHLTLIAVITACIALASCTVNDPQNEDLSLVDAIENNLLPSIIIEGHDNEGFNILDRMENYRVPGVSIAFSNRGDIVWARGYGHTSADSSRKVDEHTLFQAASISKPVAALAALSMVEEGKIGLDEDVNQYLKDWQVEENLYTVNEKVTLRRILSHSAGLTVHGFGGYSYQDDVPSTIQVLKGEDPANSGRIYPDTIPGAMYKYSGGGYTVMQKMLSDITAKDFPVIIDEYVLSKIGMGSSTYRQPLPAEFFENAAAGHLQDGSMIEGRWHTYPEMAAAGLWTTPSDLLKYALEVQRSYAGESNKVLSQEMVKEMLSPQMNNHGLGPGTRGSGETATFGHGGSNAGFRCQLLAFTELGQGVAIMTNGDMGGYLMDEILRSFSSIYDWGLYKPETKILWPLHKEDLEAYSGQYQLDYMDQELILEITLQEKHLKGQQLWNDLVFEIYPESENSFFNPEDGVSFVFEENADGTPELIVYEFGQEYRFRKI